MSKQQTRNFRDYLEGFNINKKLVRLYQQEEFRKQYHKQFTSLTRRELEILKLVVRDFNNPMIAEKLFISRYTVENHRKNINRKLSINGTYQLYRFALAFDLV